MTNKFIHPLFSVFDSIMFWTDWNRQAPKIEKAYMDGTNRAIIVQLEANVSLPNGLAIDYETHHICWADAGKSSYSY